MNNTMTNETATSTTSEAAETSVETPVAAEAATTPNEAVETAQEAPEASYELTLDELLGAEFAEDDVMSQTHKGLPPYQEVLRHLPEDGRKLIANLRASYTQKTQEIASMKKELSEERQKMLNQNSLFTDSDFAKKVKEDANAELTDVDPWSEDGMSNRIKQEAARMMNEMMKPLQQEMELKHRQTELNAFKSEHPDLMDATVKSEVAKMLVARQELSLEDAYYIVKAKMGHTELLALKQAQVSQRSVARDTLKTTSTGRNVNAQGVPQFKTAWESYQYHKANAKQPLTISPIYEGHSFAHLIRPLARDNLNNNATKPNPCY